MALTTRQRVTLYEVLEIPMPDTLSHPTGDDNNLALSTVVYPESFKANQKITQRLMEIALEPALEIALTTQLDKWYDLQADSIQLDSGAVGGVSGVSFDLKYERAMIRQRVVTVMGISREYLVEMFARVKNMQLSASVIRCLVVLAAAALLVLLAGCSNILPQIEISKAAGFRAPADYTRGVGQAKFFQSTDGKTVFWEIPYFNDTPNMMFCFAEPTINVREADTIVDGKVTAGKIIWTGREPARWKIKPGEQGHIGGKIVIPDWALKPTLHWENGGVPSSESNGEAATK